MTSALVNFKNRWYGHLVLEHTSWVNCPSKQGIRRSRQQTLFKGLLIILYFTSNVHKQVYHFIHTDLKKKNKLLMLTMLAKQNLSVLTITAGGFSWSHPLKHTNKGRSCGILSKVLVDISSVTEGPFRNVKDFFPPHSRHHSFADWERKQKTKYRKFSMTIAAATTLSVYGEHSKFLKRE